MRYKYKTVNELADLKDQFLKLHESLKIVVLILDSMAKIYRMAGKGEVEIMVTSIYRPDDLKSYHSKFQAIDLRTKDWGMTFMKAVGPVIYAIRWLDNKIQYVFEKDSPHLHIEFDDGTIEKT